MDMLLLCSYKCCEHVVSVHCICIPVQEMKSTGSSAPEPEENGDIGRAHEASQGYGNDSPPGELKVLILRAYPLTSFPIYAYLFNWYSDHLLFLCFCTASNPAPSAPAPVPAQAQEATNLTSQDPPGFDADDFDVSEEDGEGAGDVDIDDWGYEEE